jgi:hypothetical protein
VRVWEKYLSLNLPKFLHTARVLDAISGWGVLIHVRRCVGHAGLAWEKRNVYAAIDGLHVFMERFVTSVDLVQAKLMIALNVVNGAA